jgi:SAM-dependent methyltransferase
MKLKHRFPPLRFIRDFLQFRRLNTAADNRFHLRWRDRYPCLRDRTQKTTFDRHYIYHTAWAARIIAKTRPAVHTDFSSILHFCSQISAFVPVKFYDYRPADLQLNNLTCEHADLTQLPFGDRSFHSISCMHVVEHIGLGRYGDPLDPSGDLKAMRELERVLAPDGTLLFVVPVGQPVIQFNAHRIYSPAQISKQFGELHLEEFALIPDKTGDGDLIVNPSKELVERQRYGCGCFWFKRTV